MTDEVKQETPLDKLIDQVEQTQQTQQPQQQPPETTTPEAPDTKVEITERPKNMEGEISEVLEKIGKFDETKLKGYLMSKYNISGAFADDIVEDAKFVAQTEIVASDDSKWESYPTKVTEKAVTRIFEERIREHEALEMAKERDIKIKVLAREIYGTRTADKMLELAEENYSKFTHIPKDQIRAVLPLELYEGMLVEFQTSPKYMEVLHTSAGLNDKDPTDAATENFLKAVGVGYKKPEVRQKSYLEYLREQINDAHSNVNKK